MFDPDIVSARQKVVRLRVSKCFGEVDSTSSPGKTQTYVCWASTICTIFPSTPGGSKTLSLDSLDTAPAVGPGPLQQSELAGRTSRKVSMSSGMARLLRSDCLYQELRLEKLLRGADYGK